MLIDITHTVCASTVVFPGDAPYRAGALLSPAHGAPVHLVIVTTTPHIEHGVADLENLLLRGLAGGVYELIARRCASPIRAILLPHSGA